MHRLQKRLGYDPKAHLRLMVDILDPDDYYDPGSYKDQMNQQLGLTHTSSESETDTSDSEFEP